MTYWQVSIVLVAAAALFILWPLAGNWLRRDKGRQAQARAAANARLYDEHIAELRQALDNGDIAADDFAALEREQQRALLEDTADDVSAHYKWDGALLLLVFALVVPLLGWLMYEQMGARDDWRIHQAVKSINSGELSAEEQTRLRHELARRLETRPDNVQNWYLLANLAMNVQDYDQAVDAFRQIIKREPESPQIMAELAQALFLQAGNRVTSEVRRYTLATLEIDADMPTALGLAGIDAFQQGYFHEAIKAWSRAVGLLGEDAPGAKALISGIARAKTELAARGEVAPEAEGAKGPVLTVSVKLGEGVKVDPKATVFVYARAHRGAPMPLAIKKFPARDLPQEVRLDESMSMAPGMSMSQFKELEVVARISASGNAVSQSGDWQATQGPISLSDEGTKVSLTISDQIP